MKRRTYGPVPSRRFGLSLGIDVVPYKYCSLDCVYCQLGKTTHRTITREAFFPVDQVLRDIEWSLKKKRRPDVLTFAGSGEPTLYSQLGELIRKIREITDIPIVLLTNGTLLWDEEVVKDVSQCDVVAPSLDAGDEETFVRLNRPAQGLDFNRFVQGLIDFRKAFNGTLRLEVFLVAGINDSEDALHKIARWIPQIRPDHVDINTAVRPVPGGINLKVSDHVLVMAQQIFGPASQVIASFRSNNIEFSEGKLTTQEVLESIQRRPQTLMDLALSLGAHPQEVLKHLAELSAQQKIRPMLQGKETYWTAESEG